MRRDRVRRWSAQIGSSEQGTQTASNTNLTCSAYRRASGRRSRAEAGCSDYIDVEYRKS